jgi:hypothetical protein
MTQKRILQLDIHNNPVKYATIENIAQIIKDNHRQILGIELPNLKSEIHQASKFITNEARAMEDVVENVGKHKQLKEDISKFKTDLQSLKVRPDSPTYLQNQEASNLLLQEIESQTRELMAAKSQIKEINSKFNMEKEAYDIELKNLEIASKDLERQIARKTNDIEKLKEKYDPEVKSLKRELANVSNENRYLDMYNKTLQENCKKQKTRINITQKFQAPKISDMFLASSVLAHHKKKDTPSGPSEKSMVSNVKSASKLMGLNSQGTIAQNTSEMPEDGKVSAQFEFALKNQQDRIHKAIKEAERKEEKKKRKKNKNRVTSLDSLQAKIQADIKEKIKKLEKDRDLLPLLSINEK